MRASFHILSITALFVLFFACQSDTQKQTTATETTSQEAASSADCDNPETIMDPNDAKPMALMMRQMAANADSIKATILRGEKPDSLRFPFIRFYLVEPTNPKVLEPKFFENARLFQVAYKELFASDKNHVELYNAMIGKCINCHESYCSGPLRRIRKLPINM